eukprot:scaffold16656_cov101-Skeletonema_dohrnii-CCMP3373.AAC.1
MQNSSAATSYLNSKNTTALTSPKLGESLVLRHKKGLRCTMLHPEDLGRQMKARAATRKHHYITTKKGSKDRMDSSCPSRPPSHSTHCSVCGFSCHNVHKKGLDADAASGLHAHAQKLIFDDCLVSFLNPLYNFGLVLTQERSEFAQLLRCG